MSAIRKHKVTQIKSSYVTTQTSQVKSDIGKRRGLIRRLTVFAIFIVIMSYGLISTLISQSATIQEKETEKVKLEQQLVELKKEQVHLEDEIIKLNDDEYIAKIARRDYFLSEKDEIIFKIGD